MTFLPKRAVLTTILKKVGFNDFHMLFSSNANSIIEIEKIQTHHIDWLGTFHHVDLHTCIVLGKYSNLLSFKFTLY